MAFKHHLKSLFSMCQYHKETQSDLAKEMKKVVKRYPSLHVQVTDLFLHNQSRVFLCLNGTIPVKYKSKLYNIPVRIIYPNLYPSIAPIVRVMPTPNMFVKPSEYVDEDGTVILNILNMWNYTYNTIQLIDQLIAAFSTRMPVFARTSAAPAHPPQPVHQPVHIPKVQIDEDKDLCKICFKREINTVLLECAHRLMCTRCARKFTNCPVCRQPVVRVVKTYNA